MKRRLPAHPVLSREVAFAGARDQGGPPNLLVRGDNLAALAALADRLAGKVDLVYVDPPFATAGNFGAFDDRWPDLATYLAMLEPRLRLLRGLLSERGSLIVHLDWHAGHRVRGLLGELFGEDNSLGEIIWAYGSPSGGRAAGAKLVKAHDTLYWFARHRGRHVFHSQRVPYHERYLRDWFRYVDESGRRYRKRWRDGGRVERQYLDESPGMPLSTVWTDIQQVYADPRAYKAGVRSQITGYPTQKPLALLERIVALASDEGGLVVDAFCGSGTTLVAAARQGRRFVGVDAGARAVHVATRRLLGEGVGFERWAIAPPPAREPAICTARVRGRRIEVALGPEEAARADLWWVDFGGAVRWAVRERGRLAASLLAPEASESHGSGESLHPVDQGAASLPVRLRVCVADEEGTTAERELRVRLRPLPAALARLRR
jgi:DNA modification methylase